MALAEPFELSLACRGGIKVRLKVRLLGTFSFFSFLQAFAKRRAQRSHSNESCHAIYATFLNGRAMGIVFNSNNYTSTCLS